VRTSLEHADIVKLNDDELVVLSGYFQLTGDASNQLRQLRERFGLELAILTRGGQGSLLVSATEISDHPGITASLVDTIGAGDSFTAMVTVGILLGLPLTEINDRANRLAAWVCSRPGAMPAIPAEFRLIG
jgi:fructokinase